MKDVFVRHVKDTFMIFQVNPLTPFSQFGWAIASAIVCTGLFIWSQINALLIYFKLKAIAELGPKLEKIKTDLETKVQELCKAQDDHFSTKMKEFSVVENKLENVKTSMEDKINAVYVSQGNILGGLHDVAESINALAVSIAQQTEIDKNALNLLQNQAGDIKVLTQVQAQTQDKLQRLLEQTINRLVGE